jgi:hypothetical protein
MSVGDVCCPKTLPKAFLCAAIHKLAGLIGKYRPDSWSAASLGARGISCTELPCALSISRRNGVVPIGSDAIYPRGAITKMSLGFANLANPWCHQKFSVTGEQKQGMKETDNHGSYFPGELSR